MAYLRPIDLLYILRMLYAYDLIYDTALYGLRLKLRPAHHDARPTVRSTARHWCCPTRIGFSSIQVVRKLENKYSSSSFFLRRSFFAVRLTDLKRGDRCESSRQASGPSQQLPYDLLYGILL